MNDYKLFAEYLVFLDKINSALNAAQRERVLLTISAALDRVTHTPPPFADPVQLPNQLSPLSSFLTASQVQLVIASFQELIDAMYRLHQQSTRSTANHTRRRPASRRKPSHKKHS